jgi:hypothetical protein
MTLSRCAVLLLVAFLAFSALAQNETLVVDHGSAIEAAATGTTSMLALFTTRAKLAPCNCGEIDAVRVGFDGKPIAAPFRIASSFAIQLLPAVAFDGVRYLAAWTELADPPLTDAAKPSRIVAAFVAEDGTASAPFILASAKEIRPVIVWDGTQYFVFYTDPDSHAMGMTLSAQGVPGTPFAIGNETEITSAAAGGSQIAVTSIRDNKVEVTILGGSTQELASGDAYEARIAWNGRTFLVIWTQGDDIYARTLDGEPHLLAASSFPRSLQLIASGSLFFAAWETSALSFAWIDTEPFSVMATLDSGYASLTHAPHAPAVTKGPADTVALFHTRWFVPNQFTFITNDYVWLLKPGRQRTAHR